MDGTTFFPIGGALVLAALVLSFVGIRGRKSFPGSRVLMVGVTAVFALVVAATAALAVVNAREEQKHRNEELAHEEEEAAEEAAAEGAPAEGAAAEAPPGGAAPTPGGQPQASGGGNQQAPAPASATTTLDVTSPDDGALVFDPDGLEAPAGALTIVYSNPSPVEHNFALEGGGGGSAGILGETPTFSAGSEELTIDNVEPGEYTFFCSVPGHREGGMEGSLTVQ